MLNRPFSANNVNIYDEKTQNSTPANILGQNVMLNQQQHQKVFNTCTTSITGMQEYYPGYNPYQNSVTFTFDNNRPTVWAQPNQNYYYHCPNQYQSLNDLQRANNYDLWQLQQQPNQQFQCKFHLDHQTSTSDLNTNSIITSDLRNLAECLKNKWPLWLRHSSIYTNPKKLILKNVTAKIDRSLTNEDLESSERKKVAFDFGAKKDADVQVKLCCACCPDNQDYEDYKPKKRDKRRSRRRIVMSDPSSDDDIR